MDMINFIKKAKNLDGKKFSDLKASQILRFKHFNQLLIKKENNFLDQCIDEEADEEDEYSLDDDNKGLIDQEQMRQLDGLRSKSKKFRSLDDSSIEPRNQFCSQEIKKKYCRKKIPQTMEEIFEISNKNKKKNKEKKKLMTNLVKEEKNEVYSSHLLSPIIQQALGESKSFKKFQAQQKIQKQSVQSFLRQIQWDYKFSASNPGYSHYHLNRSNALGESYIDYSSRSSQYYKSNKTSQYSSSIESEYDQITYSTEVSCNKYGYNLPYNKKNYMRNKTNNRFSSNKNHYKLYSSNCYNKFNNSWQNEGNDKNFNFSSESSSSTYSSFVSPPLSAAKTQLQWQKVSVTEGDKSSHTSVIPPSKCQKSKKFLKFDDIKVIRN